ncbi:MAG: hypothetical protein AB1488_07795 [Nitrospirota bacterium]
MSATVSLNDKELLWLEGIVVDSDKNEALKFVRMIKEKVEQQEEHKCGPRI